MSDEKKNDREAFVAEAHAPAGGDKTNEPSTPIHCLTRRNR